MWAINEVEDTRLNQKWYFQIFTALNSHFFASLCKRFFLLPATSLLSVFVVSVAQTLAFFFFLYISLCCTFFLSSRFLAARFEAVFSLICSSSSLSLFPASFLSVPLWVLLSILLSFLLCFLRIPQFLSPSVFCLRRSCSALLPTWHENS